MRIFPLPPKACSAGFALMLVLIFSAIGMVILGASLDWATQNANINERMIQYQTTLYAAEAATERVVTSMLYDFKTYGSATVSNNLQNYRTSIPTSSQNSYWGDFGFSDATGQTGKIYVVQQAAQYFTNNLTGPYAGLGGTRVPYKIIANAYNNKGRFMVTNAVQQEVACTTIPVFQFAIFFNGLAEFTRMVTMNIRGRVHSNTGIYYGTQGAYTITFYDLVSTCGNIIKTNWWGYTADQYTAPYNFNGGKKENALSLTLPIGTNNSSTNVHKIIERPDAGEAPTSAMGQERYYNKAELLILVSNNTVNVSVKTPFSTTSNLLVWTNPATGLTNATTAWLTTNATFFDKRENKTQQVSTINIGKFTAWAATNSTIGSVLGTQGGTNKVPNIIFVDDVRTRSGYGQSVMLTNGKTLPGRGFTVASPNGVYVHGHYNCPNNSHLGTTNTSATVGASIVADGVTLLSTNWNNTTDGLSTSTLASRDAGNTTYNFAMVSGIIPTTTNHTASVGLSGGPHNFPRFLEDWGMGTKTATINGSIVNLYNSTRAIGAYVPPGTYYNPPTRNWSFDYNYLDPNKLPPGTPSVRTVEKLKWVNPPINTTNYAGI